MDRQKRLGTESVKSLLLKFSIPAIIGMLVNALYNIVDRIFIGQIEGIGKYAIAGVGLTFPIMTVIMAFSMLVGIGTAATFLEIFDFSIVSLYSFLRIADKHKMFSFHFNPSSLNISIVT